MVNPDDLRYTKMALNNGSGAMPALGFGTLIPDPVATRNATQAALEAGFRVIDTAERDGLRCAAPIAVRHPRTSFRPTSASRYPGGWPRWTRPRPCSR